MFNAGSKNSKFLYYRALLCIYHSNYYLYVLPVPIDAVLNNVPNIIIGEFFNIWLNVMPFYGSRLLTL